MGRTCALAVRSSSATTGCLDADTNKGLSSGLNTVHSVSKFSPQSKKTVPAMASTKSASTLGASTSPSPYDDAVMTSGEGP